MEFDVICRDVLTITTHGLGSRDDSISEHVKKVKAAVLSRQGGSGSPWLLISDPAAPCDEPVWTWDNGRITLHLGAPGHPDAVPDCLERGADYSTATLDKLRECTINPARNDKARPTPGAGRYLVREWTMVTARMRLRHDEAREIADTWRLRPDSQRPGAVCERLKSALCEVAYAAFARHRRELHAAFGSETALRNGVMLECGDNDGDPGFAPLTSAYVALEPLTSAMGITARDMEHLDIVKAEFSDGDSRSCLRYRIYEDTLEAL